MYSSTTCFIWGSEKITNDAVLRYFLSMASKQPVNQSIKLFVDEILGLLDNNLNLIPLNFTVL